MPSNPDIMHERSETLSEAEKDIETQNTDVELLKASSEVRKLLILLLCLFFCMLLHFPSICTVHFLVH